MTHDHIRARHTTHCPPLRLARAQASRRWSRLLVLVDHGAIAERARGLDLEPVRDAQAVVGVAAGGQRANLLAEAEVVVTDGARLVVVELRHRVAIAQLRPGSGSW